MRSLGFLAICQSSGHGTGSTVANVHPMILHACVNCITLVSWNRLGTTAQYCFCDASLGPNLAAFFVY